MGDTENIWRPDVADRKLPEQIIDRLEKVERDVAELKENLYCGLKVKR